MAALEAGEDNKSYLLTYGEVPYTNWDRVIEEHQVVKPKPEAIPTKIEKDPTKTVDKREYLPHNKTSPRPPAGISHVNRPEEDEDPLPKLWPPIYGSPDQGPWDYEYGDSLKPPTGLRKKDVKVFEEPFEEIRTLSVPPGAKLDDLLGFYYKNHSYTGVPVQVMDPDDPRTPKLMDPCTDRATSEGCVPALVAIRRMSEFLMGEFRRLEKVVVVVAGGNRAWLLALQRQTEPDFGKLAKR
ncbi:hypothetical protein TWF696_008016 [Orbilia brochopaga]|uniref:Uncharacterized protein n=1 Tax=Orbilia brochopaga TaxID=3140254 RepID=A0AAV9UMZ6_9PEZI